MPNGGYCLYYPSNIFRSTRGLKIGEYPRIFPRFSWGIFGHVTRSDQSRASENICWIIIASMHHIKQISPLLILPHALIPLFFCIPSLPAEFSLYSDVAYFLWLLVQIILSWKPGSNSVRRLDILLTVLLRITKAIWTNLNDNKNNTTI